MSLAMIVIVTAYLAVTIFGQQLKQVFGQEEIANAGQTVTNYEESKAIYINGQKYLPDPDVYTFLLGGVDKFGTVAESDSYLNNEQIDFISVIAYDKNKNTCKILIINRDTMMEVPVLGLGGKSAGTAFEQIALSHTYGSGLKDSAENTVDAVEKLLGGITVGNYAIMKMDAIPVLNDMVGGVSLTLTENLPQMDPSFIAGSTVTLKGDLALQFIRRRIDVSDGTNLARIRRQEQYINGFYNNLRLKVSENGNFLVKAFGSVEDYLTTDCDYVQMNEFQNYIKTYPEATIYTMAGEARKGAEFIEFYPDQTNLTQLTVDLFYKQAE
ncbi:LCP family protein [Acetobacterium woodii]|uniref:LCP family protein n=1 Tax=Acetobacterium woodii TaxID=33952 RepID=UPI00145E21C2|nr:LCP family protein [Acetobacterium woodii]